MAPRTESDSIRRTNYFTEMCSGSEAGSYLRLIDFAYHSTLGLRVIKKKKKELAWLHRLKQAADVEKSGTADVEKSGMPYIVYRQVF